MGDRVSLQFVNGSEKSVVLFNHWGGKEFATDTVKHFLEWLGYHDSSPTDPISRREPQTIMRVFVAWLAEKAPNRWGAYNYSMYFGFNEKDGDNSDNGHYVIDLKTDKISRMKA